MTEIMKPRPELWFDGPNYTADAVIIDTNTQKILLIERSDCGEWALPGGFIDENEAPLAAAKREAREEVALDLSDGQLVYRGIVDDPRNTEHAWIETSAYLFECTDAIARAGDDANDAQWFSLDTLPPLYASHATIVDRALDIYASSEQLKIENVLERTPVHGGHMNYVKHLVTMPPRTVFTKTYEGAESSDEHVLLLQKEAAIMSYLRAKKYPYIPAMSRMHDDTNTLAMEAFVSRDGWQWRAPADELDRYVDECLAAFYELESHSPPSDIHQVAASFAVHREDGWDVFDPASIDTLRQFMPVLRPSSQATFAHLLDCIDELHYCGKNTLLPDSFVLCHHDARQANIAWHPSKGVRLIDWSWADIGRPGSDITTLLIDLHKHGHDIRKHLDSTSPEHCLTMIGFWLEHASRPIMERDDSIRLQQLLSALAAYEVLTALPPRGSGV